MIEQNPKTSGPLETLFQILMIITSILVLIGGILSTCGFLLLRAHSNMLGLAGFLHHSVTEYIYEGGVFFIYNFFSAIPELIKITMFGWILIPIIFLFWLAKRSKKIMDFFKRLSVKINLQKSMQNSWFRYLSLILGIIVILFCFNQIWPSDDAKDLLFPSGNQFEVEKRAKVESVETLTLQYVSGLRYIFLSILILWGIRKVYQTSQPKPLSTLFWIYQSLTANSDLYKAKTLDALAMLGKLLIYLLFIAELLALPIIYGQNVYKNELHRISELVLTDKLKSIVPDSENLWLIKENTDSFILYFGDTQKVRFIPKSQVLSMSLSQRENIFKGLYIKPFIQDTNKYP